MHLPWSRSSSPPSQSFRSIKQVVQRVAGLIDNWVSVAGGGLDGGMAQEFAQGVDGLARVSGIGMAEDVRSNESIQADLPCGDLDRALDALGEDVVADLDVEPRVVAVVCSRENPEPLPEKWSGRVLDVKPAWQRHADAWRISPVPIPNPFSLDDLRLQGSHADRRYRNPPVLATFRSTDDQMPRSALIP